MATVARIHPDTGQQASASAATAAVAQVYPESVAVVNASQSSRNPFRKPDVMRGAFGRSAQAERLPTSSGDSGPVVVAEGGSRTSTSFSINPMPVGELPANATETPASGQAGKSEPEKPAFVLLATVGGPGGLCAVIRSGESNTRVVAVGDVLEGGYKVQKVETGRVVLKNGRDTVVIKRPG